MFISITINPKNLNSDALIQAFEFIRQLNPDEMYLTGVFFYGYSLELLQELKQETLIDWNDLLNEKFTGVQVNYCSTIAESSNLNLMSLPSRFQPAGLGQWMETLIQSKHNIEFV